MRWTNRLVCANDDRRPAHALTLSFPSSGTQASPPCDDASATWSCAHCGLAAGVRTAVWASVGASRQVFCCQGCATVAALLDGAAAQSAAKLAADAAPARTPATLTETELLVEGMHCAACATAIEVTLARTVGVYLAQVDRISHRLQVSYDPEKTSEATLVRTVLRLGYRLHAPGLAAERSLARQRLRRLLIALLCMMQVMMLSVPSYLAAPDDIEPDVMQLLHLSQLLLTLPVLGYCALPFFRAAARDLRLMRLGMDVTVTLGIWVAALASLWSIWRGAGPVYFDSISMFVALLLGSRWLQERAMLRASEHLDALARSGVLAALLIEPDGSTRTVPAQALKPGERFLVCAGETVPADGRVIEGSGSCSEALLHGESRPVEKRPGAQVLAGAVNLGDPLIVQVERAGAATVLACLARVAARAGRTRPEIVLFADRAAQGFGAALAVFAIGAALVWAELDATRIIPVEVAILIVTCPCALSLAVPLALAAGQAAMAREGVLVARAAAIETLGAVDTVLVDKTGTLTAGHMSVKTITLCEGAALDARRALELAAALEAGSSHPIACALRRASGVPGPVPTNQRQFAGVGIAACIDGVEYTLGRVDETLARLDLDLPEGDSLAVLGNAKGPLAVFSFGDPVRPSARAFVAHLEALQCEVRVLSGDRASVVAQVAGELNIANWQAGLGPEEKLAAVSALQRAHRVVAMVGDGMNDAAAVAGADTSIALGSGSALTQTRADFIVLGEDLGALERALGIARRTRRIVRQSLAWALGYNLVAIPVAALGSIRPEWAALGMALSSLGVVGNAMRLLARGRLR